MLGKMITKARKEKDITKVTLAKETGINIGHLSHIEKGERNPSHKALKSICAALKIPYAPLSCTYDRSITEDQERYKIINHISYNKIPLVEEVTEFVKCPIEASNSAMAIKIKDDIMEPYFEKGDIGYLELNANLNNKDVGLFEIAGKVIIRRFIIRKDKLVLRADNKNYDDIDITEDDNFTIIGRITNGKSK